ncbi:MAG: outer membrane beta-barrel protein [Prevotella sp.]|nr:outer membrane beta-barrel protein [Prevotella sp.]
MRKLILSIMTIVLSIPAMAQSYMTTEDYKKEYLYYYGLRLGMNLSTVSSDDSYLDGGDIQAGLNIGALVGFQLSPQAPVYLESGLFYSEKGGKGKNQGKKFIYNLNYLEVPVVIKYKFDVDGDFSVHPFAGGYMAWGIGGRIKNYGDRETYKTFCEDNFKRFDGGIRLGCGFEYQILYGEMAYDLGIANLGHDDFGSSKNGCFTINFGVNF